MRHWFSFYPVFLTLFLRAGLPANGQTPTPGLRPAAGIETIVFVRHGEKPPNGLGQITCQGLNRALALPSVLFAKFGRPDFIFAPDPTGKSHDGTLAGYDYVRPLATIEPTAVRFGLPVNTDFRFEDTAQLERELTRPGYTDALIFVAWEHRELEKIVRHLLQRFGGNPADVPPWPGSDYDRIYVLRLDRRSTPNPTITFTVDHEGLDGLSTDCPEPAH
ncbi:MAG TPA: hypothetical protein VGD78_17135 [Chthoniobacterales bacterium]